MLNIKEPLNTLFRELFSSVVTADSYALLALLLYDGLFPSGPSAVCTSPGYSYRTYLFYDEYFNIFSECLLGEIVLYLSHFLAYSYFATFLYPDYFLFTFFLVFISVMYFLLC